MTTLTEALEEASDESQNVQDRPEHRSVPLYQDRPEQKRPAVALPDFPWSPLRRALQEIVPLHVYRPPREQLGFDWDSPPTPSATTSLPPASLVLPGMAPGNKLFPFQAQGVAWLRPKSSALLADDMGLGKTPQAIYWGAERRPVLVVVPAALVYNWQEEIQEKWRTGDTVTLLVSGETEDLPRRLTDWTVTTYSQLARFLPDLKKAGFRSVIVDEAHKIKNLEAQRTQNMLELVAPSKPAAGQRNIPDRLAVTGTPMLNRPPEIFALMVFLGKAERSQYHQFLDQYTERQRIGRQTIFVGYKNLSELHEQIRPFTLRRLKKDVLKDLPPKRMRPIFTAITNAQEYREAEVNFLEWLRIAVGQEAVERIIFSVRAQILVRMNHLRQLAARGKVQPVADFLKPCELTRHKVLVFSNFIEVLESLHDAKGGLLYTGATPKQERQRMVDEFQKGPVCFFYGTIGAAGVGITLTAADRAVFVDLPWTPGEKVQAEDRIHRIGQTHEVEIIPFLAKGTIDERVLTLLAEKEKVIAQAIDGFEADRAAAESVTNQLLSSFLVQARQGQEPPLPPQYIPEEQDDDAPYAALSPEEVETVEGRQRSPLYDAVMGQPLGPLIPSLPELTEVRPLVFDTMLTRRRSVQLGPHITRPEDVVAALAPLEASDRERVFVLYLTARNRVIGIQQASIGERSAGIVPIEAIARAAILSNAAGVVLVHNHPSGDSEPSPQDGDVTRKLGDALKSLNVALLDSIVMGSGGQFTSLGAKGWLTAKPMQQTPSDFSYPSVDSLLPPPIMRQIPDEWGSRCRDPLGRWTISDLCPPVPRGEIAASTMTFALSADGTRRYDFEHMVVEATDLITSHDPFTFEINPRFTQKLQPRKRERAATQIQVMVIAKTLEPLSLLTDFRTFDRGAPIVGPDWLVESGNGRVMGLIRASKEHPERAEAYHTALLAHVQEFGLTRADVEGKALPMLIRMRVTEISDAVRQKFVEEANLPSGITRSAVEIARTDAERITLDLLLTLEVGEEETLYDALKSMRNREFVRQFLGTLPENERGQLLDAQGVVNLDGIRRIGQAVFVYVFRGETGLRLAELAFETLDNDIRNTFGGIARALGPMAQAEALTLSGGRDTGLNIGEDLATTLRVYVRLRGAGTSVADYFAQGQLETRELTPFQENILKTVAARSRSAKRIGEVLRRYSESVLAQPPPQQVGMFGEVRVTKEELWQRAVNQEQQEWEAERQERERRREREPVLVVSPLRQVLTEVLAEDSETRGRYAERIRWCNTKPEDQGAILAWRPLRNLIYTGVGYQVAVEVCESGFGGGQFQVTIGYPAEGAWRKGLLTAPQLQALRSVARDMGSLAKEVLTKDPGLLVFQVTLPGTEAEELVLKPQLPERESAGRLRPPVSERELQPILFQALQDTTQHARIDGIRHLLGEEVASEVEQIMERLRPHYSGLSETELESKAWRIYGLEHSLDEPITMPQHNGIWPDPSYKDTNNKEEGEDGDTFASNPTAPPLMLEWQYRMVIAELQNLQGHVSDPTCPCSLADIGEFCIPKHLLNIASLAAETMAMDTPDRREMWDELQEQATDLHRRTRAILRDALDDQVDLLRWARGWRKRLEQIYYSQSWVEATAKDVQDSIESAKVRMEAAFFEQIAGSTMSGLGWALGAALAGLIITSITRRKQEEKEEEVEEEEKEADLDVAAMTIPDLIATLDSLMQRLGV